MPPGNRQLFVETPHVGSGGLFQRLNKREGVVTFVDTTNEGENKLRKYAPLWKGRDDEIIPRTPVELRIAAYIVHLHGPVNR